MANLFVVIDPNTEHQAALHRAEQLAMDTGARLHLFCCDYQDDLSGFSSRKDAKHSTLIRHKQRLEAMAEPLREEGLIVTSEAYWNSDWAESVIHAASRAGANLILKVSVPHTRLARTFQRTSDITLMRKAPCPTLLVRNPNPWTEQQVLAAVALESDNPEHDLLNNRIITEAQRICRATRSTLHCVAASEDLPNIGEVLRLLDDDDGASDEELISQRFGIAAEHVHVRRGTAREVIIATADELRLDLLVIGTVARRGVQAALLGNTAEKILDQVEMDILVVN